MIMLVRFVVSVVDSVLDMLAIGPARLSPEGQEHEPPAVKAGQQRGQCAHPEGEIAKFRAPREGGFQNGVLRIEPSKAEDVQHTDPGDRECARHHRPEGQRYLLTQGTVIPHVLLVVHGVDDRACTKEKQRLEEGVRKQVEHSRAIGAHACREEHVTELRTGRIGDDALDVPLRRADRRGENAGGGADECYDAERDRRCLEHRRQAADHEYARGNHRCRMDKRGHRRRTFHGVR